jgi:hypothetical protein
VWTLVVGLCCALLGIAAAPGTVPARRLAAATFARNTLRKAWVRRCSSRVQLDTTCNPC